jgi:uncharacterized membrane protein YdjX (TVP38/TMEM64 family)
MRNWLVFGSLAILIIIPFLIWGDWFMTLFSEEGAVELFRQYGPWAWAVAFLLLIGDLFLPLPATVIMSVLGYLYGPVVGGLLAATGSFLSGLLAYTLCRSLGRKGALWILGEKELEKGQRTFNNSGGWIVAISRWLPVLPEVVACMAGLNRMDWRKFIIALACGSLPLGFVFAYIGYQGVARPMLALVISAGLPPVLWLTAQYYIKRRLR